MAWTERYVDAAASGGGTGTSAADPWTFAEAVSNSAAGMRVNFKAGTYNVTSSYASTFAGTATQSIWWRGYKTTIGDIDAKPVSDLVDGTDMPVFQTNGNYISLNFANYCHTTGLSWKQDGTGRPAVYDRRQYGFAKNCRYRITNTGAISVGVVMNVAISQRYINCEFICDSANHSSYLIQGANQTVCSFCHFKGNGSGTGFQQVYDAVLNKCVFDNLNIGVGSIFHGFFNGNVFYNIQDDAIQHQSSTIRGQTITNNIFHTVTGYCVGTTVGAVSADLIANNRYYNCSNIFENTYENVQFDEATESTDPFADAAAGDFTLNSSASSYGAGYGLMLGTTSTDYSDVGAIQHQDPTGGGGAGTYHPLYLN